MRLAVRVQPRASKNQVAGWQGASLKVRLTAPPVEGAANAALVDFLADALDLPKSRVTLLRGDTAREKLLEIGLDAAEVYRRLSLTPPA